MFIDTSGFLCRNSDSEPYHEQAAEYFNSAKNPVTTNYVLAEYVALALVRGLRREGIAAFSQEILRDENVKIIWVNDELHTKSVELLKERPDKKYSLCDAVSFVLMRERKISEALTTDKHFKQEGFIRLLE